MERQDIPPSCHILSDMNKRRLGPPRTYCIFQVSHCRIPIETKGGDAKKVYVVLQSCKCFAIN